MLSQVSTFKDLEEAEYFVAETIHQNQTKIQDWLNTTKTRLESFEYVFPNPTGTLVNDRNESGENDSAIDVYSVRVVLLPSEDSECHYIIKTTYPIESNDITIRNRYPMLGCLFGAYFNQDWDQDHESPWAVISAFIRDSAKNETEATITELKNLLKERYTNQEWYWLLSVDFGCAFSLRRNEINPTEWLEKVLVQLEYESSITKAYSKKFNLTVDISSYETQPKKISFFKNVFSKITTKLKRSA
jgi:hypothetical protein